MRVITSLDMDNFLNVASILSYFVCFHRVDKLLGKQYGNDNKLQFRSWAGT